MPTDVAMQDKPAMTVADFQNTSEFLALTENQKTWILKLVTTKDARQATLATYPKARKLGSAYTSQLSGKLLSSPHVRNALAKFYGWDDRTKFLSDLDSQIKRAKSSERPALLALKAKVLLGVDVPLPSAVEPATPATEPATPATESQWRVGDHVSQRDENGVVHYGIIRALDANGRPSQIDEVRA